MTDTLITYLYNNWLPLLLSAAAMLAFLSLLPRLGALLTQQQRLSLRIERLEKELRMLKSGTVGMGERIVDFHSRLEALTDKQGELKDSEAQIAYAHALRLIEQGVDEQTVAVNSGLSDSEIRLMQMVHGHKRSA